MRVLITGATGLIGRELGKLRAARGDSLVCLGRTRPTARPRLPFPATCFEWDHQRAVPKSALNGVDAIVNLAGEPVADKQWTDERKRLIRDSRVLGTRQIVAATCSHGQSVRRFVQGSAIGFYGHRADEALHGGSTQGSGFLADLTQAWEAELRPLAQLRADVGVAVVRTG